MGKTYIDKFSIDNILLRSIEQDIFIGSSKANSNDIVVINVVKDKNILSPKDIRSIKSSMHNLLYQEQLDNSVVLVTKFLSGVPLSQHLDQDDLDKKTREHILFEYFKGIAKYSKLDNKLINVLVDDAQVFVKNGSLHFAELIKSDNLRQSPNEFKSIIRKIGAFSRKIYTDGLPEDQRPDSVSDKILRFIDDLENDKLPIENMADILDYYKTLYFSTSSRSKNNHASDMAISRRRKKAKNAIPKIAAGFSIAAVMTCAAVALELPYMLQGFLAQSPMAYFDKINVADGWKFINKSTADGSNNIIQDSLWQVYKNDQIIDENTSKDLDMDFVEPGTYKVVLKVQDQYGKWSDSYEKEFRMLNNEKKEVQQGVSTTEAEILDNYGIIYDSARGVFIDNLIYRKGNSSIRFEKRENGSSKSIVIKDIKPETYSALSMWILSDSLQTIDFKIEGYRNKKLSYNDNVSFKIHSSNNWEMLNINGDINNIDELKITILDHDSTFWMDDLAVDSYK